jgi:hypothetical protein
MEQTLRSRLSDAELCRRNGWTPGTQLVGDEGYGPTTITITAIGEHGILARCTNNRLIDRVTSWTLHCRDWREVGVMASDKRDECGCHRECTVEMFGPQHECDNPCTWPECLTWEEKVELADELRREL